MAKDFPFPSMEKNADGVKVNVDLVSTDTIDDIYCK